MALPTSITPLLEYALNTSVLESSEDEDELMEKLRYFFDDNLILAALDLVDRDSVIVYSTPWKYTKYEVLGTTTTYAVSLGPPSKISLGSTYCSCPSFTYAVLMSGIQYTCKHILATTLAVRMSKCVKRAAGPKELASRIMRSHLA
ncbi:hypothetical protein BC629DRAFT_1476520 [Irpex lacteus]|nr:hypothetical protein BC629DRAFT_1476520 [Irpex lacteus]